MKHISQSVFSPIGLSFCNFMCRERNKAFFLSSLLVSNWRSLSQSTRKQGLLELEKLNLSIDEKKEFLDEHFVLQSLLCAKKCKETKHNKMWCNHSENGKPIQQRLSDSHKSTTAFETQSPPPSPMSIVGKISLTKTARKFALIKKP